ncbi:MAG TPA: tetratricopeptide repeat protein [Gemmatimonadota bacterium]|nr:tetratricopeptide repeat protein [Gemmatimonadota bacterium]
MKNVLQEIHDRSMWQILGLYLGASWVVLQVVDTLNSTVGMPEWVVTSSFVLLAVGLPIVMTTAFVQRGWAGGWRGRGGAETDTSAASTDESRRRRLFSWRNALLGGVGAFALLGIGTAGWLVMRTAGIGAAGTLVAKGVLDEADRILLADFENSTDDPELGGVVTEALRVDLSQTEAIALVDRGSVSEALRRMERPADTPLTEELAYEIAEREGIPAIVTGEVSRVGGGYALSARLSAAPSGDILLSHRESAKDSTQLLAAIDELAQHMRERIGDPLRSIAASPPLAEVTTANLEALRAFSEARRLGEADVQRRVALFEKAVELDSTFAIAWYALGIALGNYGMEPGRVMQAQTRAFELRDRLTERERNAVANLYFMGVTNEPRQAIPYIEATIEAEPDRASPVNNLGEAYRNLGELDTALEYYRRAAALDSAGAAIPWMNIAQMGATMGKWSLVDTAVVRLDEVAPPFGDWHRAMAFGARREFGPEEDMLRRTRDQVTGSAFLLSQTTTWLAAMVTVRGRLDEAKGYWEQSVELFEENGSDVEALRTLVLEIPAEALARGSDGSAALDAALARYPLEAMDPVVRPYLDVAQAYAAVGNPAAARRLVEEFERTTPANHQRGLRYQRHGVLGEIALAEGRYDQATAEFRQSASRPQEILPMVNLARAFDAAGQADSARVHYRRFLDSSHWLALFPAHLWHLASSLERLAELEEEAGDPEAAATLYAEFVSLWEDADPELQPRVDEAQRRLEAIVAVRG